MNFFLLGGGSNIYIFLRSIFFYFFLPKISSLFIAHHCTCMHACTQGSVVFWLHTLQWTQPKTCTLCNMHA